MRDLLAEFFRDGDATRKMPKQQKPKYLQNGKNRYSRRGDQRCSRNPVKLHIRVAVFITLSLCLLPGL